MSCVAFGVYVAFRWSAHRLIRKQILFFVIGLVLSAGYVVVECETCTRFGGIRVAGLDLVELVTLVALPTVVAFIGTCLLTRKHGVRAFCRALLMSLVLAIIFAVSPHATIVANEVSGEVYAVDILGVTKQAKDLPEQQYAAH